MKNFNTLQEEINKLNEEYILLLKARIKELEETNEAILLILNK
jgi:hypothetical protein